MINNSLELLTDIVKSRRSTSWAKMNGEKIADETVNELLALAHWAPNHGKTEPWFFYVYSGESLAAFGKEHAALYWNNTGEDKRLDATREKLERSVNKASHLIISVMKRGDNAKILHLEEIAAASAAIQNILLGATAAGIASFWSTGGMTLRPALKDHLQLAAEDVVLGLIYLGYTDEPAKEGVRTKPVSEKVKWM